MPSHMFTRKQVITAPKTLAIPLMARTPCVGRNISLTTSTRPTTARMMASSPRVIGLIQSCLRRPDHDSVAGGLTHDQRRPASDKAGIADNSDDVRTAR